MGFFDKVKNMMGVPDDSDDEEDDQDYVDDNTMEYQQPEDYAPEPEPEVSMKPSRVVNMSPSQPQMVLVRPEKFDEVSGIADHVNAKHTVVLNLEAAGSELSRRIIDFVAGAAYANRGHLEVVASGIYIVAPYYVDVSGDILNNLDDNGVLF